MNAKTGEDWLDFAKNTYATSMERQKPIDALSQQIAQNQLDASKEQEQWAEQAHDRYVNQFEPLQDKFVQQAQNWDTPEKEAEAAAKAKADVATNAAQQQAANNRQMSAMGVNPASGKWAGVDRATSLATATSEAGAENNARNVVKQQGMALEGDAINIGNGLPSQASSSVGLGLNAGTGAMNVTNSANGQFLAAGGIMNTGYQGAMAGYSNEANILQNQYNSQLTAWYDQNSLANQQTAGMMSGIGSIIGLAGMFSSKKLKKGKRKAKGNLKAVKQMPVEKWRYKEGVADGGAAEHTGPYAEDFQRATGHGDGTTIPIVDAIGVTMGAVQELSGQVDRLERAIGLGSNNSARAPKRKMTKKAA
ncbi:tail fiber domain-containing protein [Bradyrhizobium sp. SZCCHNS1012]|uniref:tail fiber domain-containing protein n=1 Tax=Bradyrhizobium sp. SZCCHNS1012 TaxID=3057297 RepID=UPI002916404C|nr:tail fiber domain-containing protein [Bradyrhizobium sp. SZCCHNS1012]